MASLIWRNDHECDAARMRGAHVEQPGCTCKLMWRGGPKLIGDLCNFIYNYKASRHHLVNPCGKGAMTLPVMIGGGVIFATEALLQFSSNYIVKVMLAIMTRASAQ